LAISRCRLAKVFRFLAMALLPTRSAERPSPVRKLP
jgi:hypothetical protein